MQSSTHVTMVMLTKSCDENTLIGGEIGGGGGGETLYCSIEESVLQTEVDLSYI